MTHGASEARAALYALALHAWLLVSVTGAGGLIFLIHRAKRPEHKPLIEEIETLPTRDAVRAYPPDCIRFDDAVASQYGNGFPGIEVFYTISLPPELARKAEGLAERDSRTSERFHDAFTL